MSDKVQVTFDGLVNLMEMAAKNRGDDFAKDWMLETLQGIPPADFVKVFLQSREPTVSAPEEEVIEGSVVQSDDPKIRWLWRPWYDGFSYERPATLILHARPVAK